MTANSKIVNSQKILDAFGDLEKSQISPKLASFAFFRHKWFLFSLFAVCYLLTMIDTMIEYYLVDFMITSVKLSGSYAGTILLITELLGVVIGPIVGYLMDSKTFGSFGKHRFWLIVSILPLGISFSFIWYIPDISSSIGKSVFYSVVILVFNVFYATILIAYEGMIPLLIAGIANNADEGREEARLNSFRLCVGTVGATLPLLLVILIARDSSPIPERYQLFFVGSFVSLLLISIYITFVSFVKEKNNDNFQKNQVNYRSMISSLFRQRPFLVLLAFHFLYWNLNIFSYSTYSMFIRENLNISPISKWQLQPEHIVVFQVQAAAAAVQIVMTWWRVNPQTMVRISFATLIFVKIMYSFIFKFVSGYWIFGFVVFDGLAMGALYTCIEIMILEVIAHDKEVTGTQKESVIYGSVESVRQLGISVSFFATGLLLDWSLKKGSMVCCSYIPIAIALVMVGIHLWHPELEVRQQAKKNLG